jgi:hypothetical protein
VRHPDVRTRLSRGSSGSPIDHLQKDLITVEVREKTIGLKDIYQAKMYKEVFNARYGFLPTAEPKPE